MQRVAIHLATSMLCLLASGPLAFAQGPSAPQPASAGDSAAPQTLSDSDKTFLSYAAEDNQAEIQLCLLAERKATQPAIKAFARLMVNDHVAIESRLAAIANAAKFELPNGIGKDGTETQSQLEPLSAGKFDAEFMNKQIEDHSHDIKKFTEQASSQNGAVRSFAAETLPILQQHLQLARAVKASI